MPLPPPSRDTPRADYVARINRVVDHIDTHLAAPLDLASLAALAHFSPWHFHRVFRALTGETLADRVRRRRVEVAAARLLASPPQTALAIALDVGFASAEVFSRAFRAHFGMTPTAWRRGAWRDWAQAHRAQLRKIHQAQRKPDQAVACALRDDAFAPAALLPPADEGASTMDVTIRDLPALTMAYLRHTGPYGSPGIPQTWQRFAAWAEPRGLMAPGRALYGISQDNPELTAPAQCRYDACVAVEPGLRPSGEVGVQQVAGGRHACVRFVGRPDEAPAAWEAFFSRWLPDSGWQCGDGPAIEWYDEGLGMDAAGRFACLLCVPVRPL